MKNTFRFWGIVMVSVGLSACNGLGVAQFGTSAGGSGFNTDSSLSYSGISSYDEKTDSTVRLHWASHPDAIAYEIYDMASGEPVYRTTVAAPAVSVVLTGLTPSSSYQFRIRMKTSDGKTDTNQHELGLTMNAAPDVPSSIVLQSPNYSPGMNTTPTLRVAGVKAGDTVQVFSDSSCTTLVGSALASSDTLDVTTSTLAPDAYTFYANAKNLKGNASNCSPSSVSYTLNACPTGYIQVVHNPDVGTTADFCVAKYDMKSVSAVATSQAAGTPWVSISQTSAKTACDALNALNGVSGKYFLISNPEWMTIARDADEVDSNWSTGVAGVGVMVRGHSDNNPTNALAASTDNDPYYGTGNDDTQAVGSGWEQRRTLTLSNGEVIWDFAGNVWTWVDWWVTPANKAYVSSDGSPVATWREFSALDANIGGSDEMKPETWQSSFPTLGGSSGLGKYYGGLNTSGGGARRGGSWNGGMGAGAFALDLSNDASSVSVSLGFRCVYRP